MGAFEDFVNANLGIRKPLITDAGHPSGSAKSAGSPGSHYIDSDNNFLYEKTGWNNTQDWAHIATLGDPRGGGGGLGGGDPAGLSGQIQYNDGGDLGASPHFLFDDTSGTFSGASGRVDYLDVGFITGQTGHFQDVVVQGDLSVVGTTHVREVIDTTIEGTISGHTGIFDNLFAGGQDLSVQIYNLSGDLSDDIDTLSGDLSDDIDTLSGRVIAQDAYLVSELEFVSGDLSDRIDFLSGDLIGDLSNNIDTLSGDLSGDISALSGDLSNDIDTLSGNLSGDISALSGNLSGDISVLSGNLSNDIDTLSSELYEIPAGLSGQIQYNDGGDLGASPHFLFDDTSGTFSGASGRVDYLHVGFITGQTGHFQEEVIVGNPQDPEAVDVFVVEDGDIVVAGAGNFSGDLNAPTGNFYDIFVNNIASIKDLVVQGDLSVVGTTHVREVIDTTIEGTISGHTGIFDNLIAGGQDLSVQIYNLSGDLSDDIQFLSGNLVGDLSSDIGTLSGDLSNDIDTLSGNLSNEIDMLSGRTIAQDAYLSNEIQFVSGDLSDGIQFLSGNLIGGLSNEISSLSGDLSDDIQFLSGDLVGNLSGDIDTLSGNLSDDINTLSGNSTADAVALADDIHLLSGDMFLVSGTDIASSTALSDDIYLINKKLPFLGEYNIPAGTTNTQIQFSSISNGNNYVAAPKVMANVRINSSSSNVYYCSVYAVTHAGFSVKFAPQIAESNNILDLVIYNND